MAKVLSIDPRRIRQPFVADPLKSKDLKMVMQYLDVLKRLEEDPSAFQPITVVRGSMGHITPASTEDALVAWAATELSNIPRVRIRYKEVELSELEKYLKKKPKKSIWGGGGDIDEAPVIYGQMNTPQGTVGHAATATLNQAMQTLQQQQAAAFHQQIEQMFAIPQPAQAHINTTLWAETDPPEELPPLHFDNVNEEDD